jgi:hypothetical protein
MPKVHSARFVATVAFVAFFTSALFAQEQAWEQYRGKPGPSGWRCNVLRADPQDHGPDGISLHDWDGDGDLDVFSNAEEGKYSRLYFNPGPGKVRDYWDDFIEFTHGKCEDSGIGDLDNDGDVDYVANGGWVYFNPGKAKIRDPSKWTKMTLFDQERRVPTVTDVDGDGLNDLIVGAQEWYRQPATGKHVAANWTKFTIGKNRWPMNCIIIDVDKDGDVDIVVPDRGKDIGWYVNPGRDRITGRWQRKTIHSHSEPMFMTVADVNGDGIEDFVIAGGNKGAKRKQLLVLLRTNRSGDPKFHEITIEQPCGTFPKGVAVMDLDGDLRREILVIPKQGDLWIATFTGDPKNAANWTATPLEIPGARTRKKMDNAWLGDLDGDGDLDVMTTEENGHWGVIWFENPAKTG